MEQFDYSVTKTTEELRAFIQEKLEDLKKCYKEGEKEGWKYQGSIKSQYTGNAFVWCKKMDDGS